MSLPHPLPSLNFPIFASFLFLSFPQFFLTPRPDYATLNSSPYSNTCIPITFRRVLCSWYRLPAFVSVSLPLVLLAAVEIMFKL